MVPRTDSTPRPEGSHDPPHDPRPWSRRPRRARRGRTWGGLSAREHVAQRRRIQVVYQDTLGSFDPRFTVERVLAEAHTVGGVPRAERRAAVLASLDAVGLPASVARRRPLELSGGQRQRVAIARALAPRPRVLVLDEPVSALDVSVQAQVLDLLLDLQRETGVAYLFISHDLGVVSHVSDRVVVMAGGRIVEEGAVDRVFQHPEHAYTQRLIASIPRLEHRLDPHLEPSREETP